MAKTESYTLEQVTAFLCGEAQLDGLWFGEGHPHFWWRKHLREASKSAIQAAKIKHGREMWLLVHDILRDKPNKTIGIQEGIDVASEAYLLLTGESIKVWFDDTELSKLREK